ncbi:hypothetical protein E4K10_31070 [Streptomyces sp. T1317-0309]|nr:hypothetical protein E4K10_31070 [Streptomyces sp. T1317-0309]
MIMSFIRSTMKIYPRSSTLPMSPKRRATGQWLLPGAEGYRLRTEPGCLDLQEFHSLVRWARAAAASPGSLDLWVRALSLWTAPVVRGITPQAARHPMFIGLQREYAAALAKAADVALQTGTPEVVVSPLQTAVRQDPLDEPLQARLILCLAAAGRQSEALDDYRSVRAVLADELGIDPGPELREAHRRVLSGLSMHRPPAPVSVPPAQLPPAPEPFTGRRAEAARWSRRRTDGAVAVPGAAEPWSSARSVAWPEWARPPSPFMWRTGCPTGFRTGSSMSTSAVLILPSLR